MKNQPDMFLKPPAPTMRVVTLIEPFATLMMFRAKRLETRSGTFPRNYRGDCAIQASKGWPKQWRALCQQEPFYTVLSTRFAARLETTTDDERLLPDRIHKQLLPTLGHIIALGEIVETHWTTRLILARHNPVSAGRKLLPQTVEQEFGNYSPGRLALEFRKVRPLVPAIPVVGMMGLWRPEPWLETEIRGWAMSFDEATNQAMHRAGGEVVCSLCNRMLADHPLELEVLSDQGAPFLTRACNGELLKL
jgi:hypothetical protein